MKVAAHQQKGYQQGLENPYSVQALRFSTDINSIPQKDIWCHFVTNSKNGYGLFWFGFFVNTSNGLDCIFPWIVYTFIHKFLSKPNRFLFNPSK